MSETKKSTMGPGRLFILLGLAAILFIFLSREGAGEKEKDEVKENNSEISQDQNSQDADLNMLDEISETPANDVEKKDPIPQTVKDDDGYTPQSSGSSDGYTPQSSGSSDGYTPQSVQ